MMFAGFVREGLPDVFGSLKWPDGTEYHGEFDDGEMSGYGRYIFGDGGEFRGAFRGGLPRKGFYHPPEWEVRRVADYEQRMPSTPLWEMSSQDLLHPEMVDMPMPQFTWSKADCMAISNCITVPDRKNPTAPATVVSDFKHISKPVTARLIWARPIHADQPLWNADEVRGKIVACMRGPRPPAKACSYNMKLYHIQNAGAVGVIFVDYDPNGGFNVIPRAASGPLWPGGPHLEIRIPAFLTLNVMAGALQEGAIHTMSECPNTPKDMAHELRVGFILCRKQESYYGMSKSKAKDLMQEFFSQRRQERAQEVELLQDRLEDLEYSDNVVFHNKEWITGNVLDSVNFLKQDKNAPPPKTKSGTVAQAMLSKVTSKEQAKELAQHAETAGAMLGEV
jgi:hypothetical protein